MKQILYCVLFLWAWSLDVMAQPAHWLVEAESPQSIVVQHGDTIDMTSPKGLSLWWNQPIAAPCTIEYRACVVMEGGPYDRLSDLNCFWMASIPTDGNDMVGASPLPSIPARAGRFVESYRLQCYYMGYGGNYNSTTRFRRYTGDTLAVTDATRRPPILKEYTDSAHLLRPNHWYDVRIEVGSDGRSRYYLDGELLVDYLDPSPLKSGWFAFRTTWSHTRLTAFKVSQPLQSIHNQTNTTMKEIYLAGGCFWGTEHFFKQIEGVTETEVGFANGHTENPTYQEVYTDETGYAETVRIRYDEKVADLEFLLNMYFKAIEPTSLNRQGHDEGTRYRTGVYYTSESDLPVIRKVFAEQQEQLDAPISVEVEPLRNFYPAEDYHQDYLDKKPDGYCHLPLALFDFARQARMKK